MPINFLTGDRRLRRMRDSAREYAASAYDPNVYSPSIDVARTTAAEGIGVERQAENIIGRMMAGGMDQRRVEAAGTAGRAMAVGLGVDEATRSGVSDVYTQLGMADEQVRREAAHRLGELQTGARGLAARREAAMHEADMMYEAERGRRRQALAGTAFGALSSIMSGPIGDFAAGRIMDRFSREPRIPEMPGTTPELFEDEIVDAEFGAFDLYPEMPLFEDIQDESAFDLDGFDISGPIDEPFETPEELTTEREFGVQGQRLLDQRLRRESLNVEVEDLFKDPDFIREMMREREFYQAVPSRQINRPTFR